MNTLKQKNLESFIFKTIDKEIEGTDIYNHNGSMWVIFTDDKKWVVEYTIENGVKQTELSKRDFFPEDILQNGIMETIGTLRRTVWGVDDIIQNGVKHTEDGDWLNGDERFINIIQNGVKQ